MDFPIASTTIHFKFTTHDSAGALVAPASAFEAADVVLYKDGSATQRSSTSGWTMTSPFDSVVGLHQISFDLSDNTDAGFYVVDSEYEAVLLPDETVDGQVVGKVIGRFRIVSATRRLGGTALPAAAADAAGGLVISDAGGLDIDARLAKLATGGFTANTFASDLDGYSAKSWLQRKSTATATDLYTVVWVKNGVDLSSGITVPKIQVIKRSDGTDQIAEVAMTQVGSTGIYKYDATGAELMTAGASYIVVFTATIDGATRTAKWVQGRDV